MAFGSMGLGMLSGTRVTDAGFLGQWGTDCDCFVGDGWFGHMLYWETIWVRMAGRGVLLGSVDGRQRGCSRWAMGHVLCALTPAEDFVGTWLEKCGKE